MEGRRADFVDLETLVVGALFVFGSIAFVVVLFAEGFSRLLLVNRSVLFFFGLQTLSSILLELLYLLADLLRRLQLVLELLEHLQVVLNLLVVLTLPVLELVLL